ncbi:MAG: DUF1501 domain-containing protein [Lewinellaceae bacterium]|nr:DUF1501 domain-containing protein [Saprospiraceae bacterium]MCB9341823.1 DUF1501 domain-containing protein [Lewinellaceae bacterium]
MKRRNFLRTAGTATALTPFIYNGLPISAMARNSVFSKLGAAASLSGKVMVFIELNGGNDGLNTLIPLDQYGNLSNHRSNLLIPENQVLTLDGTPATGLHPAMTDLKNMYADGLVSIVQNVGYPNQDYSHFRSMDIWMTASESDQSLDTGWLGRSLELEYPDFPTGYPNVDTPDPLAIQVGSIVPIAFMGSAFPMGMSISSADDFYNQYINDFVEPAPATPYGDELQYIRLILQQSQLYYNAIKAAAETSQTLSSKYPPQYQNYLADQLKVVARLIGGGLQTPVYMVSIGGFDTHSEQTDGSPATGTHAELLRQVSEAICAFQDDITLMGMADKVAGMTFSEFGRTIAENGSIGTDHGAAAPLFVFGKGVNPGLIGQNAQIPSALDLSEDVPMQHDFRSVYASVLQDWFGLTGLDEILYEDFPILPIFKGTTDTRDVARRDAFQVGNYPNPVRSTTFITFTTPGAHVVVNLLDSNGRFIMRITEGDYPAGSHKVLFDRSSLQSGSYFYQVKINGMGITKKMLVL